MRYSDALLDSLRLQGDQPADAVIAELARTGETDAVNQVLRELLDNAQAVPERLPPAVAAWLRETEHLPYWARQSRLDRGAALFAEHGVLISLILATDALVECYAARKGAIVLAASYRMAWNPYRRIAETAQFVLLVMAPGGLGPAGQSIRAIQKVRLMHGAIRHLIGQSGHWDQRELGVPINQEDLAGTLMSFSWLVVRDLRNLGVAISDAAAEDFLYTWRAIGELLGIHPSVMPVSMAEAEELATAIFRRHQGPSPEGVMLTKALLEMHAAAVPGTLFDGVVPAFIRFLAGDQVADWMAVPHTPWDELIGRDGLARLVGQAENRTAWLRRAAAHAGMAFLMTTAIAMSGYERAGFTIPTSLRQRWGI